MKNSMKILTLRVISQKLQRKSLKNNRFSSKTSKNSILMLFFFRISRFFCKIVINCNRLKKKSAGSSKMSQKSRNSRYLMRKSCRNWRLQREKSKKSKLFRCFSRKIIKFLIFLIRNPIKYVVFKNFLLNPFVFP